MFTFIIGVIIALIIYRIIVAIDGNDGKPWPHGKE
jgi:hypothetical protein